MSEETFDDQAAGFDAVMAEAEAERQAQAEAEREAQAELAATIAALKVMIDDGHVVEALPLAKVWGVEEWAQNLIETKREETKRAEPVAQKPYEIVRRRLVPEATDLNLKVERAEPARASLKNPEAQSEAESKAEAQPEERPEWADADWDKPVEPKPKPEPQSEARLVPPELGKLVARAEPRQPLSFFQYTRTPSGIVPSFENALIALKAMKLDCRLDVFHDRVIVKGYESTANGDASENLDNTLMKLREKILRQWGFDPGKEYLADALRTECLDHMFDPVLDYLDALRWDGKPRIDTWLMRYCSAKDTPVIRAFGRKFFLAGVRRVRQPGCKFDNILTMEGYQGAGKSTLLRTFAGEDNFCDNEILGLEKREQQEALQGVWIYELGELEGMRKADVTHIKLFASKTHDKARPAWGRAVVDRPRRTIFCATTNEDDYLRDPTGNRRWWPVAIGRIDLDGAARDRDQLWAEAAFAEASGETLALDETLWGAAGIEQRARQEHDPWEDIIAAWLSGCKWKAARGGCYTRAPDDNGGFEFRVASAWLLTDVLGIAKDRQGDAVAKHLAKAMRGLGWDRPTTTIRIGEAVVRGFVKREEG